ncbi:vWA domain-containing protein [Thalassoroseus pseudoceratinae]|uniref:vWA domain-containing protein n=1 Tax=Thalassoroseus pseudoceratinae TaxID=2713176 RepID=UPI00141E6C6C|nr:BatA and WFA domain-containing protein [Thalassoroseus pseudoceratinae]
MSFFSPNLFLNPGLLAGVAFIAVPIVLHFLLKSQPKRLPFPALRLLQNRRKQTVRRLQLRHLWLLLLRVLVIALLVLAIARPSLPAANYSLTMTEAAVLAGIVLLAAGVYLFFVRRWQSQRLPPQTFVYRRSVLRGGVGTMALILFALLVAWPYQRRIAAEVDAPVAELKDNLPVAAVFIFDTSDSMRYRFKGETRLEAAQTAAADYLEELPRGSRVAVTSSQNEEPLVFRDDLVVAKDDLNMLTPRAVSVPLNERVRAAALAQESDRGRLLESVATPAMEADAASQSDRYLREIYLFTDVAASGWQTSGAEQLKAELQRLPFVHVYLIDVSVADPVNVAVSKLELSDETLSGGESLTVDVTMKADGRQPQSRTVEIRTTAPGGEEATKRKRSVTITPGEAVVESFQLDDLSGAYLQGRVMVTTGDPLDADNERHFTVRVQPPPRVLILSGRDGEGDYLQEALAPSRLAELGQAPFQVDQFQADWLNSHRDDLGQYDVVCLVHVPGFPEPSWRALEEFVRRGGGMAAFLGMRNVEDSVSWNSVTAQEFLPAELSVIHQFDPPESLALDRAGHPILDRLFELDGVTGLSSRYVEKCWSVEPHEEAVVLTSYTRTDLGRPAIPALLSRPHVAGKTVMLTTAITPRGWSNIAQPSWQFLVFAHEMMQYLNAGDTVEVNGTAGEEIVLPLPDGVTLSEYILRKPDGAQSVVPVEGDENWLIVPDTDVVGSYTVLSSEPESKFRTGFSINRRSEESDLTKLTSEELATFFGEDGYRIGTNFEDLERMITVGRLGQELYPHVLTIVILVFCLEHLVANRFYGGDLQTEG